MPPEAGALLVTHLLNDDDDKPESEKDADAAKPSTPSIGANLFKSRTVLIFGEIKDKLAESVTAQLLAMAFENDDPIKVIISSPGGHVESGDVIHDMIRFIKPEVKIIGTGWVASAASHIFLGAKRENRYCLPNTRFMMHQPWGGVGGKVSDIDIEAREIIKMRERINQEIADETGQPIEKVRKDTDRNFWLSPQEAKDYGFVTHIVSSFDDVK
jgi:ATP-dependent Clp protease protease subunit